MVYKIYSKDKTQKRFEYYDGKTYRSKEEAQKAIMKAKKLDARARRYTSDKSAFRSTYEVRSAPAKKQRRRSSGYGFGNLF